MAKAASRTDRIAQLEDELKIAKERFADLRRDHDEALALVTQQREWMEDYHATLDSWVEALGMTETDAGYVFDPEKNIRLWYSELLAEHNKLVRQWNRFAAETHGRPRGRPLAASESQIDDVLKRRKAGEALRGIAKATGLGLKTVQTIVAKRHQSAAKRRREFDKFRARDFRQRKILADRAPAQIRDLRRDGQTLIRRAKGL